MKSVNSNQSIEVRQLCGTTGPFSFYREMVFRNLNEHQKVKVGGNNITNLRYADDKVLIADSIKLQTLPTTSMVKSEEKGMQLMLKTA